MKNYREFDAIATAAVISWRCCGKRQRMDFCPQCGRKRPSKVPSIAACATALEWASTMISEETAALHTAATMDIKASDIQTAMAAGEDAIDGLRKRYRCIRDGDDVATHIVNAKNAAAAWRKRAQELNARRHLVLDLIEIAEPGTTADYRSVEVNA